MTDDGNEVEASEVEPPARGGWKKFLWRFLIVVGVLVAAWVITRWQIARYGERKVEGFVLQLATTEPGWTLEEIEEARLAHAPPPERNSALVVDAVGRQLPDEWDKWWKKLHWAWEQPSNHLPTAERVKQLRTHAESTEAVRKLAAPLRDLPTGYRPFNPPEHPLALSLPHVDVTFTVVALFHYEAMLATLDGDPDRGIRAAHAALNAARSIGDEPTLVSQLFGMASRVRAAQIAEQTLAWGTPKAGLAELQAALLADADEPLFLNAIRGERAMIHRFFLALESGRIDAESSFPPDQQPQFAAGVFAAYRPLLFGDHAEALRLTTAYVEAAKLPWHEQRAAMRAVMPDGPSRNVGHLFTRLLLPSCEQFAGSGLRARARLQVVAVALACERFRQETGNWPRTLEAIPKSILSALPDSPSDGRPLRYQLLPDGIVISCFCHDEKRNFDGPAEFREPGAQGFAEGVRLWNPDLRGLPAKKETKEP